MKEDHPCKVWLNLTEGFRKDFYCESQVNVHISDKNQQNVKCVGNTYNTGGEYTSYLEAIFVPLEGKFLLIALVIVKVILNVIVRQMPLNGR